MNDLIPVSYDSERPTVLGRDLHSFLEVKERYNDWFPRMCEYGFVDGTDYVGFTENSVKPQGGRPAQDHQLTIPMAKELAMLQRTERGRMARRYFIQIEEAWNTPEAVMARALKMAEKQIAGLRLANSELTVQNQIMAPKADYFDELVERNLLTSFRDTAKQFQVGPKAFVSFLLDKKYLFRDKTGKLQPYQQHVAGGLFEVKECFNNKTEWSGTQTLVTPKGRETFRILMIGKAE